MSHFDGLAYLEANPAVAQAVISGSIPSALEHYRVRGRNEGVRFEITSTRAPNEGRIGDLLYALKEEFGSQIDQLRGEIERKVVSGLEALREKLAQIEQQFDALRLGYNETQRESLRRVAEIAASSAVRERTLSKRIDGIKGELKQIQQRLTELSSSEAVESLRKEIAEATAMREARERALVAQVDALRTRLTEALQRLSAGTRANDLSRVQELVRSKVRRETL